MRLSSGWSLPPSFEARTGAVASLFYLVFLYRVFDIYVRNAAGEILALAFLPAALLSVWMMLRRRAAYWPAVVLFGTCILQSHVLTSLLLVGASVIMLLVSLTRLRMPDVRWAIGKAAFFLCLLNVWFYAPLLWYHQNLDYYMKLVKYVDPTQQVLGLRDADFYMGTPMLLLLLAVATSIDALSVGISMGVTGYHHALQLVLPLGLIGLVSFLFGMAGCWAGGQSGSIFKNATKPELLGGVILILIGVKILVA